MDGVTCPHCGSPIALEPVPPCHEHARCGNCGLRSPRFPRFAPRLPQDDTPRPKTRLALDWVRGLDAAKDGGSDVGKAARRVVVAWDRQDPTGLADAVEAMRGFVKR